MNPWPDARAFRAFSLSFYARAPVQQACLAAQDDGGLQVNLLLLACCLAQRGEWLEAPAWQALRAASADWHTRVVCPLRALRRSLPREREPAFREQLERLETEAEWIEQAQLVAALPGLPRQAAASPADAARLSLQAYWQCHAPQQALPAPLQALARLAGPAAESPA